MNARIRKQIERRKRRIARRLDQNDNRGCDRPMMTAANIHYEIAERTRATAAGGIGALHLLVRKVGLDQAIDRHLRLLKMHLPYHESDHVLTIAYNLLAGGTCLEHLELVRTDEAYLDALGARRLPDPTTAGDFCRRFAAGDIDLLQEVFNETRLKVWRQQSKAFFEEAVLDADGTMVETTGQCKQGMDNRCNRPCSRAGSVCFLSLNPGVTIASSSSRAPHFSTVLRSVFQPAFTRNVPSVLIQDAKRFGRHA